MDLPHVNWGRDGWTHLVRVIDCGDRELRGWEFTLRGRAKKAERPIEETSINPFRTLRPTRAAPVIGSDKGLIFQSRRFRSARHDFRLKQESIASDTPEQKQIIDRFFRRLKEECVWQHRFENFVEAKHTIARWIVWHNTGRPYQSSGYKSPQEYRAQQQLSVT